MLYECSAQSERGGHVMEKGLGWVARVGVGGWGRLGRLGRVGRLGGRVGRVGWSKWGF